MMNSFNTLQFIWTKLIQTNFFLYQYMRPLLELYKLYVASVPVPTTKSSRAKRCQTFTESLVFL